MVLYYQYSFSVCKLVQLCLCLGSIYVSKLFLKLCVVFSGAWHPSTAYLFVIEVYIGVFCQPQHCQPWKDARWFWGEADRNIWFWIYPGWMVSSWTSSFRNQFFSMVVQFPFWFNMPNHPAKMGNPLCLPQCKLSHNREAIARKKRNFMKKFHKMVAPPPHTAFMKSLFRTLTVFLNTYTVLNKRCEIRLTHPSRLRKNFIKFPFFSGDGFP